MQRWHRMVFDAAAVHAALMRHNLGTTHGTTHGSDPALALFVVVFLAYVAIALWRSK